MRGPCPPQATAAQARTTMASHILADVEQVGLSAQIHLSPGRGDQQR